MVASEPRGFGGSKLSAGLPTMGNGTSYFVVTWRKKQRSCYQRSHHQVGSKNWTPKNSQLKITLWKPSIVKIPFSCQRSVAQRFFNAKNQMWNRPTPRRPKKPGNRRGIQLGLEGVHLLRLEQLGCKHPKGKEQLYNCNCNQPVGI